MLKYMYYLKCFKTLNFKVIYKTVCYEDQLTFYIGTFRTEALCI